MIYLIRLHPTLPPYIASIYSKNYISFLLLNYLVVRSYATVVIIKLSQQLIQNGGSVLYLNSSSSLKLLVKLGPAPCFKAKTKASFASEGPWRTCEIHKQTQPNTQPVKPPKVGHKR